MSFKPNPAKMIRLNCTDTCCAVVSHLLLAVLQGDEPSEWEEAERDVKQAEAAKAKSSNGATNKPNGKSSPISPGQKPAQTSYQECLSQLFSPVFLEAFILTFCAEWGDRSQIATIGKQS